MVRELLVTYNDRVSFFLESQFLSCGFFFGLLFLFRLLLWSEIFRPERFCCISLKLANARKKKKKRNRQDEKFFGLVHNRYLLHFFDFFQIVKKY
jgi:hypothetical protein